MPKVSIVMPSLNVENYIREALESVVRQTLQDIEIICVDAGSQDGTLEVLKKYAAGDNRIRILNSEIKSYGKQMNIGIEAATGEYIGIVETDDCILPDMYEELYQCALLDKLDIVKADFYRFTSRPEEYENREYITLAGSKSLKRLYGNITNRENDLDVYYMGMNTWTGIYRREFLTQNNIRHNESKGASYQDNGFWFQTITYAEKILFLNKAFYLNRRDNQESSVYQRGKAICICDEYSYIKDCMRRKLKGNKTLNRILCFFQCKAYLFAVERVGDEYIEQLIMRIYAEFTELKEQDMLDRKYWNQYLWEVIHIILDKPALYAESIIAFRQKVIELLNEHRTIIIYGAGDRGKAIQRRIADTGWKGQQFFAVTKKDNANQHWNAIEIREIGELRGYAAEAAVIVSTLPEHHSAIFQLLKKYDFKKILLYEY